MYLTRPNHRNVRQEQFGVEVSTSNIISFLMDFQVTAVNTKKTILSHENDSTILFFSET